MDSVKEAEDNVALLDHADKDLYSSPSKLQPIQSLDVTPKTVEKTKKHIKKKKPINQLNDTTRTSNDEIRSRISQVRKCLDLLEATLLIENQNVSDMEAAVTKSEYVLNDVTHNYKLIHSMINVCTKKLQNTEERYKLLTAEDLHKFSYQNLEDASDILWAGLQAATLALSRREDVESVQDPTGGPDLDLESFPCEVTNLTAESVPQATFFPIPTPQTRNLEESALTLCKNVSQDINFLRKVHVANGMLFSHYSKNLSVIQKKVKIINAEYEKKRDCLISVEQQVETRLIQVNRFSGSDSYKALSTSQLRGLCKIINKASRRLATEQAIREVYSQQKTSAASSTQPLKISAEDDTLCLVCFEKPWDSHIDPCNHVLCRSCADRLKFCPKCRSAIEGIIPAEKSVQYFFSATTTDTRKEITAEETLPPFDENSSTLEKSEDPKP